MTMGMHENVIGSARLGSARQISCAYFQLDKFNLIKFSFKKIIAEDRTCYVLPSVFAFL